MKRLSRGFVNSMILQVDLMEAHEGYGNADQPVACRDPMRAAMKNSVQ